MEQLTHAQVTKLSLGNLRQYMLTLGFSTATKLSRIGMLHVLECYPRGPHKQPYLDLLGVCESSDPAYGMTVRELILHCKQHQLV